MILSKSKPQLIHKVISTLSRLERHKSQLKNYIEVLSGKSTNAKQYIGRHRLLLLTHFTSKENARSIISDGFLKLNEKGYLSFTALHPLEFVTVAGKNRPVGFAFFYEDLQNTDLFSPIAYFQTNGIICELQNQQKDLAQKLLLEPTEKQRSLNFVNLMEVRSASPISIAQCCLLFRKGLSDKKTSERLSEQAIFQLPYRIEWIRDHFVGNQKWFYHDNGNLIELRDNRAGDNTQDCNKTTTDVIALLENCIEQ